MLSRESICKDILAFDEALLRCPRRRDAPENDPCLLQTFSIKYNKLTGVLPDALALNHDMTEFMIQNNSFE